MTRQAHRVAVRNAIVVSPGPVILIRNTCLSNPLSKSEVLLCQTHQTGKGVAWCHGRAIPATRLKTGYFDTRVLQSLRQIADDVLNGLNAHREPHQAIRNSHALAMLRRELPMRAHGRI